MTKINVDKVTSSDISIAQCKAAMLADLFAGHTGESLCMGDAGVAGLTVVLSEISDVLAAAEPLVSARGVIPAVVLAERRVN